jgi:hypothetical protein
MAITAGETLSLNSLGSATGQATKSLSAAKGDTNGPISMTSFGIDGVDSLSGYTYAVENTNETYTLGFTEAGANFSRISSRADNFTWSVPSGTTISVTTNNGTSAIFTVSDRPNATGVLQTISSNTIRVVFDDGFNDHADNYNTNIDKTVYSVDSYDGNSTALCLTADSPILLANGEIIDAGDLEEGDVLKGYSLNGLSSDSDGTFFDWSSDTIGETPKDVTIVNLTYSFASRYYNINEGEITGTAEHPMLVKDSSDGLFKFKELHNLVVGDKLIKQDGGSLIEIEITSVDIIEKTVEIVSIDVEEEDTYLVNGYVTHNKGGNSHSDLTAPSAPGRSYSTGPATISWTAPASTGTGGITAYDWQMATDAGFSTIHASGTQWASLSHNVSGFPTNTYYLRVRAYDQGLASAYSSTLTISHTFDT